MFYCPFYSTKNYVIKAIDHTFYNIITAAELGMQCLNTINGRFIECKISNYGSQCNKYRHDIILSEFKISWRCHCSAWTAVTSAGKAGNISELMRHFYTFYQEKFHQQDRCIPLPHIPRCTSSFPHPASNFSHNHIQSFLRIQFWAKRFSFMSILRPFGLWLQDEIIPSALHLQVHTLVTK